jgi:hypothetical protein
MHDDNTRRVRLGGCPSNPQQVRKQSRASAVCFAAAYILKPSSTEKQAAQLHNTLHNCQCDLAPTCGK